VHGGQGVPELTALRRKLECLAIGLDCLGIRPGLPVRQGQGAIGFCITSIDAEGALVMLDRLGVVSLRQGGLPPLLVGLRNGGEALPGLGILRIEAQDLLVGGHRRKRLGGW
jgi:hypothetical protein